MTYSLSASRWKLLDFWNEGPNVLIGGLQLRAGEIIWGLKFRGPKCAICGLKFGVEDIIRGMIFLVCHCPNHFLGINSLFETGQLIIWGLWKTLSDYLRVRENCLKLAPLFHKSRSSPPTFLPDTQVEMAFK